MSKDKNLHSHPRYDFERRVTAESIVKKLVTKTETNDSSNAHKQIAPNKNTLDSISNELISDINDTSAIFEIHPDTELAMQVLVSSIISPKDMMSTEITYSLQDVSDLDESSVSVIKIVEEYFEKTYPLKKILPKILQDVLFKTGSYPLMVLPESSIDDIINSDTRVTLESISDTVASDGHIRPTGLLGAAKKIVVDDIGLESLFESVKEKPALTSAECKINDYTTITDNPDVLKLPAIKDKVVQARVADKVSIVSAVSTESRTSKNHKEGDAKFSVSSMYRERRYDNTDIVPIAPPSDREGITEGHPLIMKLPSESVIPVHTPGNPEDHVGYFILLDKGGNPISKSLESKQYRSLRTNLASEKSGASELLQKTRESMFGTDKGTTNKEAKTKEMIDAYTSLVESHLVTRLQNGVYGDTATISNPEQVYHIMMSRALARMHTQILFVPAELFTYIAFNYNSDGIGKSLLDSSKIIASIRSMLMFANTMAALKNSVGRTGLDITLDPKDPNPAKTVEMLMHGYAKNHRNQFPLGALNPNDITEYLNKASVDVNVTGNTGYPETKVEVVDKQRSVTNVDTDLEEKMKNKHIMSFGLAPETIDATMNIEFATSLVGSNLLLAKRVLLYQVQLVGFLEDFVKKYVLNSSILMNSIMESLKEIKTPKRKGKKGTEDEDDNLSTFQLAKGIVEMIQISLPSPDTAKLENQMTAFEQYSAALELTLQAYLNTDMLGNMLDSDLEDSLEPTIAALRAYFQRQWLRKNNVMTELDIITSSIDETNFDLLEVHKTHIENLMRTMEGLLLENRKHGRKATNKLEDDEVADEEKRAKEQEEKDALDAAAADEDEPVEDEPLDDTPTDDEPTEEPTDEPVDDDGGADVPADDTVSDEPEEDTFPEI